MDSFESEKCFFGFFTTGNNFCIIQKIKKILKIIYLFEKNILSIEKYGLIIENEGIQLIYLFFNVFIKKFTYNNYFIDLD